MLSGQGISRNSGVGGGGENEYRVVTERRLPGKTRTNSLKPPLNHDADEYYAKLHELCHSHDQERIYREANEA
jgi:hypothetical protein